MKMRLVSLAMVVLLMCGCAQQSSQSTTSGITDLALSEDWTRRFNEMERRFPPSDLGTEEQRRVVAKELVAAHAEYRVSLGQGPLNETFRERRTQFLVEYPVLRVENDKNRRTQQRVEEALGSLAGKPIRIADVNRVAAMKVDEEKPSLNPDDRRRAVAQATEELKAEIEKKHGERALAARNAREAELARIAGLNLANMPTEILRAAEINLVEARSPFVAGTNWRPDREAVRSEESRLRTAIADRIEATARVTETNNRAAAMAARREDAVRQCRMQAAIAGASVPTPYGGRGLSGAIAAGFLGAVQQAGVENNALQSCLSALGF